MRGRGVVPVADKGRSAMIAGPADSAQLVKRQQARARTDANIAAVRGVYQRAITELEAHGGRKETERANDWRSEEQTYEIDSIIRISNTVICLTQKNKLPLKNKK